MIYDYIIIGASLSCLIKSLFLKGKVLILEKSNTVGGAWRIEDGIDLGCHVIVPPSDKDGREIIDWMSNFGIKLDFVDENTFYSDDDTWRSYGKEGTPIYCTQGWVYFLEKIKQLVKKNKNIKIILNKNIEKISISDEVCQIEDWKSKNVVIPSYIKIPEINHYSQKITTPYQEVTNKHLVIYVARDKPLSKRSNFNGFYEKEPKGIFDRISIVSAPPNLIFCCRISKDYKESPLLDDGNHVMNYLREKNLAGEDDIFIKSRLYLYDCAYRNPEEREIFEEKMKSLKGIIFARTHYFGHFLNQLKNEEFHTRQVSSII
jgi:hypothetical protein